jgi:Na+/H+ antiporter NhaA
MGFAKGIGVLLIAFPIMGLIFTIFASDIDYCIFYTICSTSILTGIGFLWPSASKNTQIIYVNE